MATNPTVQEAPVGVAALVVVILPPFAITPRSNLLTRFPQDRKPASSWTKPAAYLTKVVAQAVARVVTITTRRGCLASAALNEIGGDGTSVFTHHLKDAKGLVAPRLISIS